MKLKEQIINYFDNNLKIENQDSLFSEFVHLLESGKIRAAMPDGKGNWTVNEWVKKGILLLFRHGKLIDFSEVGTQKFFDKHTLPLKKTTLDDGIRIVPGGSSIRAGAYVAKNVICMPPMYINIGSYIDEGTMIDSHALVGTCAQIGKNIHLSAASQIGGVLEPPGARPVIVEDDVMIGGNCGIYEGVLIRKRAVLGSGVILTSSTRIYDLVNETVISKTGDKPLVVPENAVIIAGSRPANSSFAKSLGLQLYAPIIVKYRDAKTGAKTALEESLREK